MKKALKLFALLAVFLSFSVQAKAEDDQQFRIAAGDVLQINVWKEDGMDREVLVLPNGEITFPLVGTVKAQGLTPQELQDSIKKKLAKLIPDAFVSVSVKAALGHTVSVIGQVAKPGEFIINHRMTVMQALSQAGGLTPYASEGSVMLLRHKDGKETSISIPYDDIASGDELDKNITVEAGDVIVVPSKGLF